MIHKPQPFYQKVLLFAAVLFAALLWVGDYQMDARVVTLRYLLFTLSGFIAFITPYLLFPDKYTPMLQLANISGRSMAGYILRKIARTQWPIFLLLIVLVLGDLNTPGSSISQKVILLLFALMLYSGLLLMSVARYVKSGPDSQFWQESERGREMRKKFADYFKYPLDPGTIPSMINTLLIAGTGMIAVVAGAWLSGSAGMLGEPAAGLIVLVAGIIMFSGLMKNPERSFYPTNAFYGEFFGSGTGDESVVERRKVEQLWWVPAGIRHHVWQFLQQTDRRLPAGRVIAAGHIFVWFIAYQRPGEGFITALWVFFALSHQLLVLVTLQPSMSPGWLLRWIAPARTWFASRFWMQLRWLVPLLVSINLQAFIFGYPGLNDQIAIIAVYLISAAAFSAVGVLHLRNDIK